jgi:hypothetical protein
MKPERAILNRLGGLAGAHLELLAVAVLVVLLVPALDGGFSAAAPLTQEGLLVVTPVVDRGEEQCRIRVRSDATARRIEARLERLSERLEALAERIGQRLERAGRRIEVRMRERSPRVVRIASRAE